MLHGTWLLVHAIWLMLHGVWLLLHAPWGPVLAFAARRVGGLAFGARALERAARMKKVGGEVGLRDYGWTGVGLHELDLTVDLRQEKSSQGLLLRDEAVKAVATGLSCCVH